MYQLCIIIIVLFIYLLNYYKVYVDSNKYININKNCDIYSTHCTKKSRFTIKTNNTLNSNANSSEFDINNSNVDNITFMCPFSTFLNKTHPKTPIKQELLVNFNNYYVYNSENKLIDRAVLTTSNTNTNKFLICNEFPNKHCKTVYMYLVDSSPKVQIDIPDKTSIDPENAKALDAPFSDSSLVYDIDIIHKNIVKKRYDPYTNVFEVVLSNHPAESNRSLLNIDPIIASSRAITDRLDLGISHNKSGILGTSGFFNKKHKRGVLLQLDRSNPNLVYELNGVKLNEDLTSLNALKYNKNNLDSSYVLISHNRVSNRRSFLVIKLKYLCPETPKSGVLIRVTRLNNSGGDKLTKGINYNTNKYKRNSKDLGETQDSVEADAYEHEVYGSGGSSKIGVGSGDRLVDAHPDGAHGGNGDDRIQADGLGDAGGADSGGDALSGDEAVFDDADRHDRGMGVKLSEKGDKNNADGSQEAKTEEWMLNDGEEFERLVELGNNFLRIEFIVYGEKLPSGGEAKQPSHGNSGPDGANYSNNGFSSGYGSEHGAFDGAKAYGSHEDKATPGRGVRINGYRLRTDRYTVLATKPTNYMVKFDNKTYKLAIKGGLSSDSSHVNINESSQPENRNYGTSDAGSSTKAGGSGILGHLSAGNIKRWIASLISLAVWAFTLANIGLNAPRFYFESLNYVMFLVLFYGNLTSNRSASHQGVVSGAGGAEVELVGRLGEAIIDRLLIYVENSEELAPMKLFLALNAMYAVNACAVLLYLVYSVGSNFEAQPFKGLRKYKLNVFVLFNYLLLLMLLVFLKCDKSEAIYVVGHRLDSFCFNSITLMLAALIVLILYQLYPRLEVTHSLNRSLFQMIEGDMAEHNQEDTAKRLLASRPARAHVAENGVESLGSTADYISSTLAEAIRFNNSQKQSAASGASAASSLKPKKGGAGVHKLHVISTKNTLSANTSESLSNNGHKHVFSSGYVAQAGQNGKNKKITFSNGHGSSKPPKQAARPDRPSGAKHQPAKLKLKEKGAERGSKRQRVIINDKYRLLYINAVLVESSVIVIYFMLSGNQTGIYLVKFLFWLLISAYIQSQLAYYDEKRINKYLLIKALKYLVMASLMRVHIVLSGWRRGFAALGGSAGTIKQSLSCILGPNITSVFILLCLNQCVNHKSLKKLYKLFKRLRITQ